MHSKLFETALVGYQRSMVRERHRFRRGCEAVKAMLIKFTFPVVQPL
ncbi:MAG: hypothetical protein VB142_11015 [Burkholderia sp.]